ncbi:MAG TPA: hypothetical protein DEO88_14480 [Syntrophobacteraceae bacterium]|nr:hypothetical protein [Syntrophobacteraceae bacterium]
MDHPAPRNKTAGLLVLLATLLVITAPYQNLVHAQELKINGTVILSDSNSPLVATNEYIGYEGGTGTLNQTGGTNSVATGVIIGGSYSTGTYDFSGGYLTIGSTSSGGWETIGNGGTGTFIQTGGSNNAYTVWVGNSYFDTSGTPVIGTGTFNLSGAGSLTVTASEAIGSGGTGVFTQGGGTNSASSLIIGDALVHLNPDNTSTTIKGHGTYNLNAGSLSLAQWETIGNGGTGIFNQTGGSNTANTLWVGTSYFDQSGTPVVGAGTFTLSATGSLTVTASETIGSGGTGVFNQEGGIHAVNSLTVGNDVIHVNPDGTTSTMKGTGTYNLSGGTLTVTNGIVNNGSFNYSGGDLNANLTNNGSTTLSGSGTRTVNGDVINSGTFKVTGTNAVYTGSFTNNGAYISDPSTQHFVNLTVGSSGYLQGGLDDKWIISGNFISTSTSPDWNTALADLEFDGTGPQLFSFIGDQTWNSLMIDQDSILSLGLGGGTMGSLHLDIISGLKFDSSGLITNLHGTGVNIYYDAAANGDLYGKTFRLEGGGFLIAEAPASVPEPSTMLFLGSGLIGLVVARRRIR